MNNNEIWMVSVDNVYSFDNMEKRSFLTINKKEAKDYFKKMVKEYIKNELETVSDLLDKKFLSLSEIIDYIEEIQENKDVICMRATEIHDIRYNYGIDVNKEKTYALFTVSKHTKELLNNHNNITEYNEDYYIIFQKVKLGEEVTSYGLPSLDNVDEIDDILNNL